MTRPFYVALFTTTLLSSTIYAQSTEDANTKSDSSAASSGASADAVAYESSSETADVHSDSNKNAEPYGSPSQKQQLIPQSSSTPSVTQAQPGSYEDANVPEGAKFTQEDYDELMERVEMMEGDIEHLLGEQDKLKTNSALDRLNWSGSYRFNYNFFHLEDKTQKKFPTQFIIGADAAGRPIMNENDQPESITLVQGNFNSDRDEWLAPSWTHHLKLAMTYDFGESLRFYSQLGVYKYFNEALNTIMGSIDHGSNAYPRDNSFRLERVYFDWFVTKWLAVSVGRIASPDGPPTELKENVGRRSGWGVQMVNATIDTVMGTFYLADKTYLRVFYSPFGNHGNYEYGSDNSLFDDGGTDILHSWGALFEIGIPRTEDSIFQLGFLHIPKFTPRNVLISFPGLADPIAPSDPTGNDLGMFMGANTLLLLKNLFDSGLDLFAAYGMTILRPTNERMVYKVPIPTIMDTTELPSMAGDIEIEIKTGLASWEENEENVNDNDPPAEQEEDRIETTNFGHAIYAGFRYTLPTSELYPTRLGGEVNWGTKYHLAWSHPNDQLLNTMGNKGISFEGYIIQQLVPKHLFCRLGYIELWRNYVGQFVGPTQEVDHRIRNIYLLIDLSW